MAANARPVASKGLQERVSKQEEEEGDAGRFVKGRRVFYRASGRPLGRGPVTTTLWPVDGLHEAIGRLIWYVAASMRFVKVHIEFRDAALLVFDDGTSPTCRWLHLLQPNCSMEGTGVLVCGKCKPWHAMLYWCY